MTKKLLLSAASVAAVLIAGSAQAGEFKTISVGSTPIVTNGSAATKAPYTFAGELRLQNATTGAYVGPTSSASTPATRLNVEYRLTNTVTVAANASGTYTARFDISGGKFVAPVGSDITALLANPVTAPAAGAPGAAYVAVSAADDVSGNAWYTYLTTNGYVTAAANAASITAGEAIAINNGYAAYNNQATSYTNQTDALSRISVTAVLNTDGQLVALISVATHSNALAELKFNGFQLAAGLTELSGGNVDIQAQTRVLQGGADLTIDTTSASALGNGIIAFAPFIGGLKATSSNQQAALTGYTTFGTGPSTVDQAQLTTGIRVVPNYQADGTTPVVRYGAFGGAPLAVNNVVSGGSLNVKSDTNQVRDLVVVGTNIGLAIPSGASASTRSNTGLTAGNANYTYNATTNNAQISVLTGSAGLNLWLDNKPDAGATPAKTAIRLEPGAYNLAFTPTYANAYVSPTSALPTVLAGNVNLEGTNFVAPWVALQSSSQGRPLLRIANGSATDSGAIFVTLRAHNGSAATSTRVQLSADMLLPDYDVLTSAGGIGAGKVVVIDGTKLGAKFGTNAANGDVQITIQGGSAGLTAALRVRDSVTNTTFEQRLGDMDRQSIKF